MTDFTAEVAHLDAAYRANRVANTTIAAEVKGKYRAIIAEEIRIRRQEADLEFARTLARVKEESGMPLHVIQDRVLHTKSWNRWTYWRDLANIEPERVTIANAREDKKRAELVFEWIENALHIYKNPSTGVALPGTLVYPYYTETRPFTGRSEGLFTKFDESVRESIPGLETQEGNKAFFLPVLQEIKRAFRDGELTEETAPVWDQENPEEYYREVDEIEGRMYELNGWVKR